MTSTFKLRINIFYIQVETSQTVREFIRRGDKFPLVGSAHNIKELLQWSDPTGFNQTILHYIARYDKEAKNDVIFLNDFLDPKMVNAKSSSGKTCIHYAAEVNNVNFLLGIMAILDANAQVILRTRTLSHYIEIAYLRKY